MLNDLGLIFSLSFSIAKHKNICKIFLSLIYEYLKKNIFHVSRV